MKYNLQIVLAYFAQNGLPAPVPEFKFHLPRKWRFDFAWPGFKVALEVQGGIFVSGRHSRGASLLKEWEKLNTAAMDGWVILYCQPCDLCTLDTVAMIRMCLQ